MAPCGDNPPCHDQRRVDALVDVCLVGAGDVVLVGLPELEHDGAGAAVHQRALRLPRVRETEDRGPELQLLRVGQAVQGVGVHLQIKH